MRLLDGLGVSQSGGAAPERVVPVAGGGLVVAESRVEAAVEDVEAVALKARHSEVFSFITIVYTLHPVGFVYFAFLSGLQSAGSGFSSRLRIHK